MRALIQGMDERLAWERYLHEEGEPGDRRRVCGTIQWIKDTFAAAARREQRPGTARLILLDPERFARRVAPTLPSLEEFALANGLEDFSEEEQLEAYVEAHPQAGGAGRGGMPGGASNRRARLIDRQLEALRWLEHLVVHDPRPLDGVQAWLNPALATRLRHAGLLTLQDLADTMNQAGARWWRAVPGIGRHKAARLTDWLRAHAPLLQLSIGEYAITPRRQLSDEVRRSLVAPGSAVRPLEKFVPPQHLDGRHGDNRGVGDHCAIAARTDVEAVRAWIDAKGVAPVGQDSSATTPLNATQRSYRREGERLLLWAVLERGKALSSLQAEDLVAYFDFLKAPPAHWCGSRAHPRWSPQWRPLEGALSPAAHRQAKVIVHGLLAHLARQRYLRTNPCKTLLAPPHGAAEIPLSVGAGRKLTHL
ncbi:phage integrase family protein [Xenophilus azovorans]|uniref:phage integrase family protein n=1 Tax=Xenophilus azovorans TaxID=151755 RepID=UPI0009FED85E|nr:phage integrase family protein [Xenophilus azovorans]